MKKTMKHTIMTDESRMLMTAVKVCALRWQGYWKWTGPENIRSYELHRIRGDMALLCAAYRAERKKEKTHG